MTHTLAAIAVNVDGSHTEDDLSQLAAERDVQIALLRHRQSLSARDRHSAAVCDDCGSPIPVARRRAIPGIRTCVDCQRAAERMDRRYG